MSPFSGVIGCWHHLRVTVTWVMPFPRALTTAWGQAQAAPCCHRAVTNPLSPPQACLQSDPVTPEPSSAVTIICHGDVVVYSVLPLEGTVCDISAEQP